MASSPTVQTVDALFRPYNGSILIAINTTWLLYGCLLVRMYNYYTVHGRKDYLLKFLVAAVGVAGTLHLAFGTAAQWGILVDHWGDPQVWVKAPWPSALGPFTSGLNGFIVHVFFVARIFRVSRFLVPRLLSGAIALASLLAFAGSIVIMVFFLMEGSDALQVQKLETVIQLWAIATLVSDVLIAVTMSAILAYARSQTNVKPTQNLLIRLIFQSIETGTVTAVVMLLDLICYETMQHQNSVYMVWEYASGPLYGNVLIYVLNSRSENSEHLGDEEAHFSLGIVGSSTASEFAARTRTVDTSFKPNFIASMKTDEAAGV